MGHATAENLLEHFQACTEDLNLTKLKQVSMDGPNVNWKFHRLLESKLKATLGNTLISIGSCGLHIVHGAFKDCVISSGWNVTHLLKCLYYLFKDTPARREDYTKVTGSCVFPFKFCMHRWLENIPVAERVVAIWSNIQIYVKATLKGDVSKPSTASFESIAESCRDPLILAKLHCFISVAKEVSPFLQKYQTDKPMVPFLSEDLYKMMRGIMQRFIKGDVISRITNVSELLKVDVYDEQNYSPPQKITLGFAVEDELSTLLKLKKICEKQVLEIKFACRSFLVTVVQKLLDKSPLNYPIVRYLKCLDPRLMSDNKVACLTNMKMLLKSLHQVNQIDGGASECDVILKEFQDFLDMTVAVEASKYKYFDPYSHGDNGRVDVLLHNDMSSNPCSKVLWKGLVSQVLLLSHGQATVERGFSVNKNIEFENLQEHSFVARRTICDHIRSVGGIKNVLISKPLLVSAAQARNKYMLYLDEQHNKKVSEEKKNKKKKILDEIEDIKKKRRRIESDITELSKSADKYADKAEQSSNLTFLAKSNSLRRTSKEKMILLQEVCTELDKKLESLKKD